MNWDAITDQQWLWFGAAAVILVLLVGGLAAYRSYGSKLQNAAVSTQQNGWTPTGRIDFSNSQSADHFVLQAEDTRVVDSVGGVERREIRWRKAILEEAKAVVVGYYAQRNLTTAANFVVRSLNNDTKRAAPAEPRQEVEPVRDEGSEAAPLS